MGAFRSGVLGLTALLMMAAGLGGAAAAAAPIVVQAEPAVITRAVEIEPLATSSGRSDGAGGSSVDADAHLIRAQYYGHRPFFHRHWRHPYWRRPYWRRPYFHPHPYWRRHDWRHQGWRRPY